MGATVKFCNSSSLTFITKPRETDRNSNNTREHMETSRLNIVLQGVNVEDGARICAPHFEVFHQKEETKRSRGNFEKPAWKSVKQRQHVTSGPVHFRAQRMAGEGSPLSYVAAKESLSSNLISLVSLLPSAGASMKHL